MFDTLLVHPLFNLLALIYALTPGQDFGIAVIILTVIVRLALWPLVNKQLHSQRALQKLQPETKKIREKAKGDRTKEAQMLQELYKEKGINPFASLLPLLIQIPLLIALFFVLRDIVKPGEIAHIAYEPIRNLGVIKDIISSGANFHPFLLGIFDLSKSNFIIALAAAATQFFQTRMLTPKIEDQPPETQALTKATLYVFPVLTFVAGITLPAALPLYWTFSSLIALYQQRRILNKDVAEMKENA